YQMLRDVGGVISHRFEMPTLFWLWQGERVELVTVHDEAGRAVTLRGNRSFTPKDMPGLTRVIGKSEPSLVKNLTLIQKHNRLEQLCQDLALRELFVVPMISRDQVLGVLMLGRQEGHPPIDADEMGFAQQAAINVGVAAENATLYQEAKSADRLKSEFLANMSHELRTPLNSIIGFSRVILKGIDGPLTDMQRTDLEAIHDSGRHLLNLINDVLDLSKIEAGKMEFIFEPVDVNTVVKGVLSTALALVKDKPVELQRDVEDGLPNIIADERRIRQVVLNLVGNASKFTEEGYIKVSAWREGREVIIAVQDSGIGIPKERYGAVFKEFEQVDSSSTRSYGGTGLGLPVSKKFVEAHGGRIWFESEVGMGTTFFVALPIGGPKAEEPEEEEAKARAEESLTVLTVDDDEGVVTLFRRYLEKQGYHVVGLTKGERVLEEVKRLKPYAVTLDIIMPTKDGWEIIRELKSDPETRDVPIVVCSIISEADKGLSMGVADYLVKPILERDLLDALARLEQQIPSNVLVVDDNPDDRKLLRRYLEEAGYSVEEAPDGAAAISKIHDWLPDLVVLDLMMPEVDGFAVIENLKSSAVTSKIPVVVVTAKELTADERALLQQRVESLLQKGLFDQERLLQDVAIALERLAPPAKDAGES
ncbi:MAG TPA: response regulator, partial [Chloroflexi bacterium]|nr:response regulator [Chloroflexota bacterium]